MSLSPASETEPIPGYTIRERIGAGGYGEVWTAEAPGGLEKAIKFVYGYLDEARASRELKALNRIKTVRHPFLLSLERIEIVDGQLLIVTELAENSLKDRYEECRAASLAGIPRDELLRYLGDAAEALDFMNERHGLQHLDVKPENLLLSAGRIKVADFGLVKDLQEINVSMMGGLTPAYAAPEVFSSQPSPRSDQYSLAILFQELLTGILPFPGRSAAQLASQHLSSRPNVSPLPEADRPVITRALAKDPQQRFASCMELVEHLRADRSAAKAAAGGGEPASPADARKSGASSAQVATQQIAGDSQARSRESDGGQPAGAGAAASAQQSSALHTRVAGLVGRELSQPLRPTACAPHDTTVAVKLQPLVIVSVGGAAALTTAAVLEDLRRQYGPLHALPAIQTVYLDADPRLPRELEEAGYAAPPSDRTVIARLRRVQDYRSGSQHYLKWLSRRWLYNIPKSQTPDSLRPLGRLAIVDHQQAIEEKLNEAIRRAVDPQALAATAATMKAEFDSRLRVMVIASSAGGVGGGALLDVGDWIREIVNSAGIHAEVQALLLHGTGRQSNRQELAVANTFATLAELHDRMRRDQVGETQRGCPFDDVNLHLLGEHLAPEQWRDRTRIAARYVSLLLSPAGARVEAARRAARSAADEPAVNLSSFHATVIGKSSDGLTGRLLDSIQANVVRAWRLGKGSAPSQLTSSGAKTDPHQTCRDTAAELAAGLSLTAEPLMREMSALLEKAAQRQLPSAMLQTWQAAFGIERIDALTDQQLAPARRLAHELLGIEVEGTREFTDIVPLDERSEPLIARFLQSRSGAVRELISSLADQPAAGIAGAEAALGALRQLLGEQEKQFGELYEGQRQEGERQAELLGAIATTPPAERKRNNLPARDVLLMQYFTSLSQRLVLRKSLQVVRYLDDLLAELQRNMRSLDRELAALAPESTSGATPSGDETPEQEGKQTQLLREAAEQLLEHEHRSVVARIDADLRQHVLARLGGFGGIVLEGKTLQNVLHEPLRRAVRTHVESALQQIRLTEIVSLQHDISTVESPGQTEAAELLQCGGAARWLLMLPEGSPASTLPAQLAEKLHVDPAVDYHQTGEVTLFCLAESIPLSRAAAHLIGHAPQYVEIASRLHTRNDIEWLPLFVDNS